MKGSRLMVLAGALCASAAFSQTANPNDGNWEVSIPYPSRPISADLTISGETGMFRSHGGGSRNNANTGCGGKDTPVSVVTSNDEELKVVIHYSKVLDGCRDVTFDTHRTGNGTFAGTWPDTRAGAFEASLKKK